MPAWLWPRPACRLRAGMVAEGAELAIGGVGGGELLRVSIAQLKAAWQSTKVV